MRRVDEELKKVLRLSLELGQTSNETHDVAPTNGTALAGSGTGDESVDKVGQAGPALATGAVDAMASEKHGRWFNFDDRQVGTDPGCA